MKRLTVVYLLSHLPNQTRADTFPLGSLLGSAAFSLQALIKKRGCSGSDITLQATMRTVTPNHSTTIKPVLSLFHSIVLSYSFPFLLICILFCLPSLSFFVEGFLSFSFFFSFFARLLPFILPSLLPFLSFSQPVLLLKFFFLSLATQPRSFFTLSFF